MRVDRTALGYALAFGALWAAEEALTGLLLGRYGLAQVVWMRFALHLLIVAALWGRFGFAGLLRTRRKGLHIVRSLALVAMPACWMLGARRGLSPATLMSVFWLAPLVILAMARLILGERVSARAWLGTALASIGVFVMTGPHQVPGAALLVFPAGMALAFGVFLVLTRVLRDEPEPLALFYLGLGVCAALAPLAAMSWVMPRRVDLALWFAIALMGIGALLAMGRLVARSRLSRTAPMAYLQIPFAMGIGWSLGQHQAGWHSAAGMAVLLLSVLLAARRRVPPPGEPGFDSSHLPLVSRLESRL